MRWNSGPLMAAEAPGAPTGPGHAAGDVAALSGHEGLSAPVPSRAPAGERPPRRRPCLLVVDDEQEVLSSVYNLLRIDYRVVTCPTAAEALDVLRNEPEVHAILTDQRMPMMTGVELLRQAKAARPETTRLLFTAYADIHAVIDAINQGHVFRYLSKPWSPAELVCVVAQAVEHHDLIVEKNRLLVELQAANIRLTEANRLKSAFIEVASHELNTPVSLVLGMLDLWKLSSSPQAAEGAAPNANADTGTDAGASASAITAAGPGEGHWADRIGQAARRMARTVERMLKLARHGDFGAGLETTTVALGPLVERAVEELSPYLKLRRQSIALDVPPGLAPITADPDKLADVFVNLLANAIKFTPDGGQIQIQARDEPDEAGGSSGGWARVSVRDAGGGIPEDEQPHLFEPFFTGFDTLRHSSGDYQFGKRGIGLGLWLVKSFVELHGGRVEVSSAPGQGSTFSVLLPRGAANGASSAQGPGAGERSGPGAPSSDEGGGGTDAPALRPSM